MKIILKDFNYKGQHFDEYEGEFLEVDDVETLMDERTFELIRGILDSYLEDFKEYGAQA